MDHRSVGDKIVDAVNIFLLGLFAAATLLPFLYIFSVSFSSYQDFIKTDIILWPKHWVTDAYRYILESDRFIRSIFVTVYITLLGTFVNLLFTSTMAYALTRNLWGQRVVLFMVVFTILFSPGLIPLYIIVKQLHLINSYWSLILPVAITPLNLIIIRQFFQNIPHELHEAARIDGASELQTFLRIVLPLSKPALAAFGLFYAVDHWNRYFSAILYLNQPEKWPIQVVLRQMIIVADPGSTLGQEMMQAMENPPPPETIQMAAILVATIPILVVYPFLQKHFAKGVMLGSVKG